MDDFILQTYRSITDDLLLLYDAYMLISRNSRRGVRSASEYLDVVKMLIQEEAADESRLLHQVDPPTGGRFRAGTSHGPKDSHEEEPYSSLSVSYSLHSSEFGQEKDMFDSPSFDVFKVTWEYFRTVILQFLVEETSQYVFWSSKAMAILNDDILHTCSKSLFSHTMFRAWTAALQPRWIQGLSGGLLPYLCAKSLSKMEYIVVQTKRYTFASLGRTNRLIPGTLRKKKKQFSANTLIMSRSISTSETSSEFLTFDEHSIDRQQNETSNDNIEALKGGTSEPDIISRGNRPGSTYFLSGMLSLPTMMTPSMILYRCVRYTLSHPFYVVVLLMLKSQNLSGRNDHSDTLIVGDSSKQNWLSTVVEIAAKRGSLYILFRGLRSVIAACLVPYDFSILGFGVVEMLLYRRMTRPIVEDELSDIKERSLDANIYTSTRVLTTGTRGLLMEAQGMTMRHGASSMLVYSVMSCFLYLPGLCNFMAARGLLFLVTGPSTTRRRQLLRRKELVNRMFN